MCGVGERWGCVGWEEAAVVWGGRRLGLCGWEEAGFVVFVMECDFSAVEGGAGGEVICCFK